MILDEYVEVKIGVRNQKHYKDLGYEFDGIGDTVLVKQYDVPLQSCVKIHVQCDCCKELSYKQKGNYMKSTANNTEPYYCQNCASIKRREYCQKYYGVDSVTQLESVKQKIRETSLRKYGVEYTLQAPEVRAKIKQTVDEKIEQGFSYKKFIQDNIRKKYGVDNVMDVPEIKERAYNGLLKALDERKDEIIAKRVETNLAKYGVPCTSQSPDVQEKVKKTLYKNGTCPVSIHQLHIHEVYGGELNYPFHNYSLDIYLKEENIDVEYDGSGHTMAIYRSGVTQEEFERREIIRNTYVKKAGIKCMRIVSVKDYLPSDETLLRMLEEAKEYFSYTNHSWITYDINESKVYNAENRDGMFYDFGECKVMRAKKKSQTA